MFETYFDQRLLDFKEGIALKEIAFYFFSQKKKKKNMIKVEKQISIYIFFFLIQDKFSRLPLLQWTV